MSERVFLFDKQLRLMVPETLATAIQDAAVKDQTSVSEFVRAAIREELRRVRRREKENAT
jgi:metal-responsive CopG/Arc/MetJ family transcriptional regulator